jgi:hypothetical protein
VQAASSTSSVAPEGALTSAQPPPSLSKGTMSGGGCGGCAGRRRDRLSEAGRY